MNAIAEQTKDQWIYQVTQFEKMAQQAVMCDICGETMQAVYGDGWDNDMMVCQNIPCGAEIVFPTSTECKPYLNRDRQTTL